ncbi:MAG: flagellar basal body rod protein FlgB [Burkholderiaceae bacterium]|nr:flagellar basal body rod protein FlgB [Roseateles sp.]MBV8471569.1 flagellar basal body rod protein FlgB [Burkholderiaceae bacterium]
MINRLTDALNFQTQALVLRSERQRLLASNIANADTPGYQAREMDFAGALRNATSSLNANGSKSAGASAAGSLPGLGNLNSGALTESTLQYALASQTSMDNNTVDMDRERASFVDNTVKYEATLSFIASSVKSTLEAMKSANGT